MSPNELSRDSMEMKESEYLDFMNVCGGLFSVIPPIGFGSLLEADMRCVLITQHEWHSFLCRIKLDMYIMMSLPGSAFNELLQVLFATL